MNKAFFQEDFDEQSVFILCLRQQHEPGTDGETLPRSERNHHFCRNAVKITPCTVIGTLYDTGCGFPAFQPEGNITVKAELIEISIADWAAVDRLEGYPRLYDRQLISCTLADGTTDTGWIYIMNNLPPMATVIISGDWKGHRHG